MDSQTEPVGLDTLFEFIAKFKTATASHCQMLHLVVAPRLHTVVDARQQSCSAARLPRPGYLTALGCTLPRSCSRTGSACWQTALVDCAGAILSATKPRARIAGPAYRVPLLHASERANEIGEGGT